ncbi:ABC transporter substrate-binding protein [Sulfobacillus thermosulfidooxidans]|uniref:ABC transporter substrate-binding protein n=1 Tax=Sulfobacillus thermosulfidooxidans TaxID=28034 RepID=UPI0004193F41|nr:ABC transporter substrate-binding protein [Sulfobacillus thermosulfidooxidans]
MPKIKSIIVLLSTGLLTLSLSGCGSHQSATTSNSSINTITIAEPDTPDTLDPQKTGAAITATILSYVGNTLVTVDPWTKQVEPDLAKRWTVSSNGLVYTFFLRHHVTFQDGTPFNAQAMAYTLNRAMNPATHGNIATALLQPVSSIKVLGPYTLQITLKHPYAPFLSVALSSPDLMAISPTAVKKEGAEFAQKPIGTGPLEVEQYIPGKSLTLVRNPHYDWAPPFFTNHGPVKFQKLIFDFLSSSSTVVAGLKTGEISVAGVPYQQLAGFEHNAAFRIQSSLRDGLGMFLVMNFKNPALQNLAVRKAINYVINRHEIVKLALDGAGQPAYSPLPSTIFGYDPKSPSFGYHYHPNKAKQLLTQAGFVMGPNGYRQKGNLALNFSLYSSPITGWSSAAQIIQQNLQAVGIKTTIHNMDIGTLITDMEKGQQDLGIMGYTYTDPDVLYLFFDSHELNGGLNMSQYSNPYLDKLLTEGREATNPTQRAQIYHKIQRFMVQQAVIAPIYNEVNYTVYSSKIHGLQIAPGSIIEVQDVQ